MEISGAWYPLLVACYPLPGTRFSAARIRQLARNSAIKGRIGGFLLFLEPEGRKLDSVQYVAEVKLGQTGRLVLSGLPGEVQTFSVKQMTPVSTPQDGHNTFRIEAQLADSSARLRPGMEGVGKILVGRARLIWIWTHGLTDWARLAFWNWLP